MWIKYNRLFYKFVHVDQAVYHSLKIGMTEVRRFEERDAISTKGGQLQ